MSDRREVPDDYICPITAEIMTDPVLSTSDGFTYEREAITEWLRTKDTSPKRAKLESKTLIPNHLVRSLLRAFNEAGAALGTASSRAGGAGGRRRRAVVMARGSALRYLKHRGSRHTRHTTHQTLSCPSGMSAGSGTQLRGDLHASYVFVYLPSAGPSSLNSEEVMCLPPPHSYACGRVGATFTTDVAWSLWLGIGG